MEDLRWLGLTWSEGPDVGGGAHGPYVQSQRMHLYRQAFQRLQALGLVYRCCCSRKDIAAALSAPHAGDEEPVYPGTCRPRPGRHDAPDPPPASKASAPAAATHASAHPDEAATSGPREAAAAGAPDQGEAATAAEATPRGDAPPSSTPSSTSRASSSSAAAELDASGDGASAAAGGGGAANSAAARQALKAARRAARESGQHHLLQQPSKGGRRKQTQAQVRAIVHLRPRSTQASRMSWRTVVLLWATFD